MTNKFQLGSPIPLKCINLRQPAQDSGSSHQLSEFGQEQFRLAENLKSLAVPAYFNPRESYAVIIRSNDIKTSNCMQPICNLLRRLSRHLNLEINVVIFEESNHFEKINPNQINIDPRGLRNLQAIKEFVNLKGQGLAPETSSATEVLKHELTHLIFFKFSRGNDHFFAGRYGLLNIPGYPTGMSFDEALTFGLANLDREKVAKKAFIHRSDALYFPGVIDQFLKEMTTFLPKFKEFIFNNPQVVEVKNIDELREDYGMVTIDLLKSLYQPKKGFTALTVPAEAIPYRGHNNGTRYFHLFLADDGRSFQLFSNHKITDINNWLNFFEQQGRILSLLDEMLDPNENPNLRKIRSAFTNPENRFRVDPVTCEGLF